MTAIRTARERARAELTSEIKKEAGRQLAAEGAQRLSLRSVARELGMASSALYRYFASRDELLTALIVDAYAELADRMEAAAEAPAGRARWRAVCAQARAWAVENPHEYALVYGTPVPGYQAPQDTIGPAARIPLALLTAAEGATPGHRTELPPALAAQAGAVTEQLGFAVPDETLVAVMAAWTRLFGVVSFELFGHLKGSADPADAFYAWTVDATADDLGLPPG